MQLLVHAHAALPGLLFTLGFYSPCARPRFDYYLCTLQENQPRLYLARGGAQGSAFICKCRRPAQPTGWQARHEQTQQVGGVGPVRCQGRQ